MILGTIRAVLGAVYGFVAGVPGPELLVELATVRSLNTVRTVSGDVDKSLTSFSPTRSVQGIP